MLNEPMKITIGKISYDIDTDSMKGNLEFCMKFQSGVRDVYNRGESMASSIHEKIVEKIANKYFEERSDDVIAKVDIEKIVKRVQLATATMLSGSRR